MTASPLSFRQRHAAGEHLIGTFIKTPTIHGIEILGAVGMDFIVIDQEHAPFDRSATDNAIFAARAVGVAPLVRVPGATADNILAVLDCGAAGILAPHVSSVAKAIEVSASCRYLTGKRGFSGSVRAAGYGGSKMRDYAEEADRMVTVIAQIEDAEALDEIEAIAAVEGIDGLFIGRGDLSVSLRAESSDSAIVRAAAERIAAAAKAAGKPISVFVGTLEEAKWLKSLGASAFVVSSDQGFMRKAASAAVKDFRTLAASE